MQDNVEKKEVDDLLDKYKHRIEEELGVDVRKEPTIASKEYKDFKKEYFNCLTSF